jgi:hypothetical protein
LRPLSGVLLGRAFILSASCWWEKALAPPLGGKTARACLR